MSRNSMKVILSAIAGTILGFFISKQLSIPYFEIAKKVNVIDAITLIVTICIAVFLSMYYDTHKDSKRATNELLLKRAEFSLEQLELLENEISDGENRFHKIMFYCKLMNSSVSLITDMIGESNADSPYLDELRKQSVSLRKLLSDDKKSPDGTHPVQIKKGVISYSSERSTIILNSINEIRKLFVKFQISLIK